MRRAMVLSLFSVWLAAACGPHSDTGEDGSVDDLDASIHDATADASQLDLGDAGCGIGQACGDGGVCTGGGVCCDSDRACSSECCTADQVCSFQTCVTPGTECVDDNDCDPADYCDYSLGQPGTVPDPDAGCQGGVEPATGRCLPRPPGCAQGQDPGTPPTCIESCEYHPPVQQFTPEVQFSWGVLTDNTNDVMMAPIVVQLDDDNCDGTVDEKDIPDIVFLTFTGGDYNHQGTLRAISILGGQVVDKWTVAPATTSAAHPGRSIAGGDLDGVPGAEIVTCTEDGRVRAFHGDGSPYWLSDVLAGGCSMPSLADMDQNGTVEVVTHGALLAGTTGATLQVYSPANSSEVVASDIDGDGVLDIVTPSRAYDAGGTLIVDTGLAGNHVAVGDLDNDGVPEVVAVDFTTHTLSIWHIDAGDPNGYAIVREGVDINSTISPNPCPAGSAGSTRGGGPPTIADFNGDGSPDVGLAGGIGYVVFDGVSLMDPQTVNADTVLWLTLTQDCSSAQTGSSVFDFDGDGHAEVVYADETHLRIYDGATGTVLFETCNTSGTLFEYPLVADVTGDDHADIVVASNAYSGLTCDGGKTRGIRIFGDTEGKWVRTRRIWNEHAYHVTNVNDDGTIPMVEPANYLQPGLNNFRQNVQPAGQFAAPDLVVSVFPRCTNPYGMVARVYNLGEASVGPGVVVGFYEGDPAAGGVKLGEGTTTQTLYALGSEDVFLELSTPPAGLVYAVVDDGNPPHPWHECRTDNNTSTGADPASCIPN